MEPVDPRDKRIAELEAEVAELKKALAAALAENATLKARLGMNSTNSSMPPSSDRQRVDRPKKEPSGRKRGGQPGHEPHQRRLLPPDRVDKVVDVRPNACERCGKSLRGNDAAPRRHQVIDLVPKLVLAVEYRLHALVCPDCRVVTRARLPAGVPKGGYGPRILALIACLSGRFLLSKRLVTEFFADVLDVEISTGVVCKAERIVSEAVAPPVEQARAYVRAQASAHLDETGWWQEKARAWLWVAATQLVAVFTIARSRGAKVAKEILGDFAGVLHSDRWSAYHLVDVYRRQVCWAHLIRDFRGMVERGGAAAWVGKGLLEEAKRIFEWWPRVRDGTLTRRAFYLRMRQVERRVGELLQSGEVCADARTAGMCKEIRKVFPALWTFVRVEGIEPTNNMAERDLRRAVLWRKACFGTDSAAGSRYVERVLTVVMTLRKQKRAVHRYLTEACEARLRGMPPPSLLPVSHPAALLRAA